MSGLFVTLDGPSGVGKSTVAVLLRSALAAHGVSALLTTEPSGSSLGDLVRYGTHDYCGLVLACLVAADRYRHLEEVVRPALLIGSVVVCDRYVPSSLVLQQFDGVEPEFVRSLNSAADRPGLAVILTGDPERSYQRAARRGTYSRFHEGGLPTAREEVRLYEEVADELVAEGWPVLRHRIGAQTPEEVMGVVFSAITSRLA